MKSTKKNKFGGMLGKIGKSQKYKKIPSLIFDIFRDGQVSCDIKTNNLYYSC
jgi:hypothetical protein